MRVSYGRKDSEDAGGRLTASAMLHLLFFNEKILSEVGFEPTPSYEDQNLSLAP